MARFLDRATPKYLEYNGVRITGYPFTIAGWLYLYAGGNFPTFLSFATTTEDIDQVWLTLNSSEVARARVDNGGTTGTAQTANAATVNAWNFAIAVFASSTSRTVRLNNGAKDEDTTDLAFPSGMDSTALGIIHETSLLYKTDGYLAEIVLWAAALTDGEQRIARYVPPWRIRPESLAGYWPLRQGHTWDRDVSGNGYHMTPYGSPGWAPHPGHARRYWHDRDLELVMEPPAVVAAAAGLAGDRGILRGMLRGVGRGVR